LLFFAMQKIVVFAVVVLAVSVFAGKVTPKWECSNHYYELIDFGALSTEVFIMMKGNDYYEYKLGTYQGRNQSEKYVNCDYKRAGACVSVSNIAGMKCTEEYTFNPKKVDRAFYYDTLEPHTCPVSTASDCTMYCNSTQLTCMVLDNDSGRLLQSIYDGTATDYRYVDKPFPTTIFAGAFCDGTKMKAPVDICGKYK